MNYFGDSSDSAAAPAAAARAPWRTFERSTPASTAAALPSISRTHAPRTDSTSTEHSSAAAPAITTRGIAIAGWTVSASKGPIANSAQMDTLSTQLAIPPPEMLFPANALVLTHEHSGFTYTFDAVRALASVHGVSTDASRPGLDLREHYERTAASSSSSASARLGSKPKSKGIKVAYAQEWGKSRTEPAPSAAPGTAATLPAAERAPDNAAAAAALASGPSTSFFGPGVAQAIASAAAANASADIADARDYDWTYSNTWPGTLDDPAPSTTPPHFRPASDPVNERIPLEKLGAGSEPILFYDELVLYEDELADNGSSMLTVKVRVMPSGLLVLQRFLLRVDNVLFRMFDTRMYVAFHPAGVGARSAPSVSAPTVRPGAPSASRTPPPPPVAASPTTPPTDTSSAQLQQGIGRISLGPTRRQMRAAAEAKEQMAAAAAAGQNAESGDAVTGGLAGVQAAEARKDADGTGGGASATESPVLRVIRECAGWEASHAEVKSRLPPYKAWDLSPLTDPNWIASTLQSLAARAAPSPASLPPAGTSAVPTAFPHASRVASVPPPSTGSAAPWAATAAALPPPSTVANPASAAILGEVDEEKWEGVGSRVDVALVPFHRDA